jgi:hypothetical protein
MLDSYMLYIKFMLSFSGTLPVSSLDLGYVVRQCAKRQAFDTLPKIFGHSALCLLAYFETFMLSVVFITNKIITCFTGKDPLICNICSFM